MIKAPARVYKESLCAIISLLSTSRNRLSYRLLEFIHVDWAEITLSTLNTRYYVISKKFRNSCDYYPEHPEATDLICRLLILETSYKYRYYQQQNK